MLTPLGTPRIHFSRTKLTIHSPLPVSKSASSLHRNLFYVCDLPLLYLLTKVSKIITTFQSGPTFVALLDSLLFTLIPPVSSLRTYLRLLTVFHFPTFRFCLLLLPTYLRSRHVTGLNLFFLFRLCSLCMYLYLRHVSLLRWFHLRICTPAFLTFVTVFFMSSVLRSFTFTFLSGSLLVPPILLSSISPRRFALFFSPLPSGDPSPFRNSPPLPPYWATSAPRSPSTTYVHDQAATSHSLKLLPVATRIHGIFRKTCRFYPYVFTL